MKRSLALLEVFPYYEMREEEPEHGYEFTDEEIEFILDAQERVERAQDIMAKKANLKWKGEG